MAILMFFFVVKHKQGSGCGTAVEHVLHNREVMGSNPARWWAFFTHFVLSLIRLLPGPSKENLIQ